MWQLLFNVLLLMIGAGIGVMTMCFAQISKQADKKMEELQRRNAE